MLIICIFLNRQTGSVLVNDLWNPPGPHLPTNFVHDFQQSSIKSVLIQGQVRLRHFLGRALQRGQSRGPSASATGQVKLRHFLGRALRLRQARGPSDAATWSILSMSNILDPCTKLIEGGGAWGGSKNHSLGNYRQTYIWLGHF